MPHGGIDTKNPALAALLNLIPVPWGLGYMYAGSSRAVLYLWAGLLVGCGYIYYLWVIFSAALGGNPLVDPELERTWLRFLVAALALILVTLSFGAWDAWRIAKAKNAAWSS